LDALAVSGGMFGTARLFSAGLGYRDRHGLARALRRDGLPPLEELAAWVRMIRWVLHWEQDHTALCEIVLAEGMDVLGADLKNGLLSIDLARPEPERTVRAISIKERQ